MQTKVLQSELKRNEVYCFVTRSLGSFIGTFKNEDDYSVELETPLGVEKIPKEGIYFYYKGSV